MGYYSWVDGDIKVRPFLTEYEVAKLPQFTNIMVEIEDSTINPITDCDTYRAYHVDREIQKVVDMFPDRLYTGFLEIRGVEDELKLERVIVQDGKVKVITPQITWPDMEV